MRALIIVLDGVGVGSAPDAFKYNDEGANTLGHIFSHREDFDLPALFSLGLGEVLSGNVFHAHPRHGAGIAFGRMRQKSAGKDTVTGLWEIAGIISEKPFANFSKFPEALVREIEAAAKVEFVGNQAADGNNVLNKFGPEHLKTGKPILSSAEGSVLQVAAHEKVIPRKRLHEICRIARRHANAFRIARVAAQPFTGIPGKFTGITPGRHDYPMVPPRTILNAISETGLHVEGIGTAPTAFARNGISRPHPTGTNEETLAMVEHAWRLPQDGLVFASLPEFDHFGCRRDIDGFAGALMRFDAWLAGFLPRVEPEDLLIITAGHGNDPAFGNTGHTREEVPLLVKYDRKAESLGIRESFADVAANLAAFFHLKQPWPAGEPFFKHARKRGHLPR